MRFEAVDRPPFCEFCGYWDETINRWRCEGLPMGMSVEDYMGFDGGLTSPNYALVPLDLLLVPRFASRTLEENERYKIVVDEIGITKKILKSSSSKLGLMPQHIDWPVKSKEDFEKIKKRFDANDPRRFSVTWSDDLIEYYNSQTDMPVGLHIPGFYGTARELMGTERLLITFYKSPKLVSEIFDFWTDFLIEMVKKALPFKIDYAEIWEDCAYKNGPHVSPKLFRQFILPGYKKITSFLKKNNIKIIMVDSDGDLRPLLPLLIEGGVNCIFPLEVQAGMDVSTLRKEYGENLAMIGNIDKRALIKGKEAIRKEVNSKLALTGQGGYIPSVDHLVPPDVPFENYKYYIDLLKQHIFKKS